MARNIVRHCLTCIIIRKNTYLRHLSSLGSVDPSESLRKCRISKLALSAHKVLSHPGSLRGSPLVLAGTNVVKVAVLVVYFGKIRRENRM